MELIGRNVVYTNNILLAMSTGSTDWEERRIYEGYTAPFGAVKLIGSNDVSTTFALLTFPLVVLARVGPTDCVDSAGNCDVDRLFSRDTPTLRAISEDQQSVSTRQEEATRPTIVPQQPTEKETLASNAAVAKSSQ